MELNQQLLLVCDKCWELNYLTSTDDFHCLFMECKTDNRSFELYHSTCSCGALLIISNFDVIKLDRDIVQDSEDFEVNKDTIESKPISYFNLHNTKVASKDLILETLNPQIQVLDKIGIKVKAITMHSGRFCLVFNKGEDASNAFHYLQDNQKTTNIPYKKLGWFFDYESLIRDKEYLQKHLQKDISEIKLTPVYLLD